MYLPELPRRAYQDLLASLDQEFTYTFGGCTVLHGLEGSYLSNLGWIVPDRVNLIYADTSFPFEENFKSISHYA